MATTLWPQSGVLQHELTTNDIAFGATVEFFDGNTTNPKIVYQDSNESVSFGSLVEVDQYGRWPNIFVPTGLPYAYLIRSGGAVGTTIHYADNVPNPDPGSGSGTPPPAETIATGTPRWFFETGDKTGWVRINGRTIGNAGALPQPTERENADTENLFKYIWNTLSDAQAPIAGGLGRGASADADWVAGRSITLPDMRGGGPIGADDMGNTAAGRFPTYVPFSNGDATTVGSVGGYNGTVITSAQMPAHLHALALQTDAGSGEHSHPLAATISTQTDGNHTHSGTTDNSDAQHNHSYGQLLATGQEKTNIADTGSGLDVVTNVVFPGSIQNTDNANASHVHTFSIGSSGPHAHLLAPGQSTDNESPTHQHTITGQSTGVEGESAGLSTISGFAIVTWYMAL